MKKKSKFPYRLIKINGKRKLYHRFLMEEFLGRELSDEEVVHHVNENPYDNRMENLEVKTISKHHSDHAKGNHNMLGKKLSPEARRKVRDSKLGKPRSEECKQKMSKTKKEKYLSGQTIPWNKGMLSEKTVEYRRNKTVKGSPEYSQKLSDALKGKPKSREHKNNLSKACKGRISWNKGKTRA